MCMICEVKKEIKKKIPLILTGGLLLLVLPNTSVGSLLLIAPYVIGGVGFYLASKGVLQLRAAVSSKVIKPRLDKDDNLVLYDSEV